MAESNRRLIHKNIESELKTIPELATVVLVKKTPPEIDADDLPQAQIWKAPTVYEEYPGQRLMVFLVVDIFVIIEEEDEDEADRVVDLLRDLVIAKMYEDIKRGGYAHKTRIVDDFEGVHDEPEIGQLRLRFEMKYLRSTSAS